MSYPLQELRGDLNRLYQELDALCAPTSYTRIMMQDIEEKNKEINIIKKEIEDILAHNEERKDRVRQIYAEHGREPPAHLVNDAARAAKRPKPVGPANS